MGLLHEASFHFRNNLVSVLLYYMRCKGFKQFIQKQIKLIDSVNLTADTIAIALKYAFLYCAIGSKVL